MSSPKKIDLGSLKSDRRKKGRIAKHDPKFLAELSSLEHGEGIPFVEAKVGSDEYKAEMAKALPAITKANPDGNAEATFENRWLSRYRQRAQSMWNSAGLPKDEFDFVILNDGNIFIGRK